MHTSRDGFLNSAKAVHLMARLFEFLEYPILCGTQTHLLITFCCTVPGFSFIMCVRGRESHTLVRLPGKPVGIFWFVNVCVCLNTHAVVTLPHKLRWGSWLFLDGPSLISLALLPGWWSEGFRGRVRGYSCRARDLAGSQAAI